MKVFVIFGVILVVLALGVLYGVKHIAMNDQTPPLSVPEGSESLEDRTDTDKADENANSSTTDEKDESTTTNNNDAGSADESTTSGTTSSPPAANTNNGAASSSLPKTGPTENAAGLVLGILAASTVAYVRSRRFA